MNESARRVIYEGRVQGVGFRATAARLANGFAVSGFVRNLPDRTVELVARGAEAELDAFLGAIDREFSGLIGGATSSAISPESVEPSGFSIRY